VWLDSLPPSSAISGVPSRPEPNPQPGAEPPCRAQPGSGTHSLLAQHERKYCSESLSGLVCYTALL
jgi:hypothetical protein